MGNITMLRRKLFMPKQGKVEAMLQVLYAISCFVLLVELIMYVTQ